MVIIKLIFVAFKPCNVMSIINKIVIVDFAHWFIVK